MELPVYLITVECYPFQSVLSDKVFECQLQVIFVSSRNAVNIRYLENRKNKQPDATSHLKHAIAIVLAVSVYNPLTAVSRSSGYKLFVTRYRQPAFRIEHYMQKRAVSRCYG